MFLPDLEEEQGPDLWLDEEEFEFGKRMAQLESNIDYENDWRDE